MSYHALGDDRPGRCEGCGLDDFPAPCGPSLRQITWNAVLGLWLCADCRYSWSNWVNDNHATENIRQARKPMFLNMMENKREAGFQGVS